MHTAAAAAAETARRAVGDVIAGRALRAFYVSVLAMALVGSAAAARSWLGWWFGAALAAVGLYELGGVALSIFADRRRQKGERAVLARLASAAFAAGAVAVNLLGHRNAAGELTGSGYFFAGFSLAGYVIWLLDAEARRRDALRDEGKLAEPPPVYGVYQWARHPWLTRRARALAVDRAEQRLVEQVTSTEQGGDGRPVTPMLGRAGSLAAALAQVAQERRLAAIRSALRSRIAAGVDPAMATIAVNTYDLGRVASGLADGADYPGLTALLGAELVPARIADAVARRRRRWSWWRTTAQTAAETAQTGPQTAAETGQTALQTGQTAAETAPGTAVPVVPASPVTPGHVHQDAPATGNGHSPARPTALAPVEPYMLAHLARVMAAYPDWNDAIVRPSRHPEALTLTKIQGAAGISGKQTASEIRIALLSMRGEPDAAQEYVTAHTPTAVT